MIEYTLRFGVGNSRTATVEGEITIAQVVGDAGNRQCLGYPGNVKALINRVEQNQNSIVSNNDIIDLETVGTAKAAQS